MNAQEWLFHELQIDQQASYQYRVAEKDLDAFAQVSGDMNPLHMDPVFAKDEQFHGRVAHGMFLGALVSQLVGMRLPGLYSLILTEQLDFKKPVYIGDELFIEGRIRHRSEATKIIEIQISIIRNGESVSEGMVRVRLLR